MEEIEREDKRLRRKEIISEIELREFRLEVFRISKRIFRYLLYMYTYN